MSRPVVRYDEGPLRCCTCLRRVPVVVLNPNNGENVTFICEACVELAFAAAFKAHGGTREGGERP